MALLNFWIDDICECGHERFQHGTIGANRECLKCDCEQFRYDKPAWHRQEPYERTKKIIEEYNRG